MSENEIPPPRPSSSIPASKQTSTIPLKKETVRVTLKASDAPPAAPGAPKPPMPSGISAPPAPSVAAPTVGGAPRPTAPAPAPTIALRPAGAPGAPAPAPTIRLNTAPGPGAPTVALKTAPLGAPAGQTVSLPKATVQLQPPTQPLGTAGPSLTQAATIRTADDEEEGAGSSMAANVLSILGFLAAAAVLVLQSMTVNLWDGWGKLF
jgi:hypothetical protein